MRTFSNKGGDESKSFQNVLIVLKIIVKKEKDNMKKITKKLLCFILTMAFIVSCMEMPVVTVKAETTNKIDISNARVFSDSNLEEDYVSEGIVYVTLNDVRLSTNDYRAYVYYEFPEDSEPLTYVLLIGQNNYTGMKTFKNVWSEIDYAPFSEYTAKDFDKSIFIRNKKVSNNFCEKVYLDENFNEIEMPDDSDSDNDDDSNSSDDDEQEGEEEVDNTCYDIEKVTWVTSKSKSKIYFPVSKSTVVKGVKLSSNKKFTRNGYKLFYPAMKVKLKNGEVLTLDDMYGSFKLTGNSNSIGKHTMTLQFTGKYSHNKSCKYTYTVVPGKPKVISKKAGKNYITLKISKSQYDPNIDYEIYYKESGKKNYKKMTLKNCDTVNLKINKLKRHKKYYFKIRAYKTVKGKKYYSSYVKTFYVKTK